MGSTEPAAPLPTLPLGLAGWTLRAWRADDAPALAAQANDVEVWRWMSDAFPHPYTLEIATQWVGSGHVDFGGHNWAIAYDDAVRGGCGIAPGTGAFRCSAEVGWWLARDAWGRGVGSAVALTLVARAFEDPQITRVFAPIHSGNARSMRVAEKAGLALEGVQRRSAIKAGQAIDRHLYAVVR